MLWVQNRKDKLSISDPHGGPGLKIVTVAYSVDPRLLRECCWAIWTRLCKSDIKLFISCVFFSCFLPDLHQGPDLLYDLLHVAVLAVVNLVHQRYDNLLLLSPGESEKFLVPLANMRTLWIVGKV